MLLLHYIPLLMIILVTSLVSLYILYIFFNYLWDDNNDLHIEVAIHV